MKKYMVMEVVISAHPENEDDLEISEELEDKISNAVIEAVDGQIDADKYCISSSYARYTESEFLKELESK